MNSILLRTSEISQSFFKSRTLWTFAIVVFFLVNLPEIFARRMFSDEILFFRVGYSQFYLPELRPQIATPLTTLAGLLLGKVVNYKAAFLLFRVLNFALFSYAIWSVPRFFKGNLKISYLFLGALMLHPNLIYYFGQVRYDALIFILAFLYGALFVEKKELSNWSIIYALLLILSTLKGVYYFGGFVAVILYKYCHCNLSMRTKIQSYFLKLAFAILCSFSFLYLIGVFPSYVESLKHQFFLSSGLENDSRSLSYMLSEFGLRGGLFYYFGFLSILYCVKNWKKIPLEFEAKIYLFILMILGWLYFFRHPFSFHPMASAANLVVALAIAYFLFENGRSIINSGWHLLFVMLVLVFQITNNPTFYRYQMGPLVSIYTGGYSFLEMSDFPERARSFIKPTDKVFDPIGILYYAQPCDKEWYLDAPTAMQMRMGRWFSSPKIGSCDYAIYSTQFRNLSLDQIAEINSNFTFGHLFPLMVRRQTPL